MNLSEASGILIVKLSSIGDTIHAIPSAASLRERFPQARITWAVEGGCAQIVRCLRCVDEVIEINTPAWRRLRDLAGGRGVVRAVRALREPAPAVAVDFQGLLKSAVISRLSGADVRVGFDRPNLREPAAGLFYTHRVGEIPPASHVIEICSALLRPLGIGRVPRSFPLRFPDAVRERAAGVLTGLGGRPFVVLNPGGGWPTKRWPPRFYARIARLVQDRLGWAALVPYGPGDLGLVREMEADAPGCFTPVDVTLPELGVICGEAEAFLGGDTGPMHLASAVGTPVLALFGPTDPVRNGPFSVMSSFLWKRLGCSCCYRRRCDSGGGACMSFSVEEVWEAFGGLLARCQPGGAA